MARSEQLIMDEDGTLPKDKVRIRERWGGVFQTRLNKKSPKLDQTITALDHGLWHHRLEMNQPWMT